jgi:DNA-binding transcriptional MocR family regulator
MGLLYAEMSESERRKEKEKLEKEYEAFKAKNLKLNMSRGVPAGDQLDLSQGVLGCLKDSKDYFCDGTDTRSYGMVDGLPSAKKLFAELLDVDPDNVIVGNSSSLNMMYDMIMRGMCFGIGGQAPWLKQGTVRFICVVPGYDRHFAICESCGIEMVTVRMREGGPDMDAVEELVKDPAVKGIWCVPKYSNPDGTTYSDETVRRFAALKPAAPDFRVYWDNAYCIHDLYDEGDVLLNIMDEVKKTGNENLVLEFASTSKISFPGSGIACLVAGKDDIAYIKRLLSIQMICPDKTNQLRHVRYFKNADGMRAQMKKHAALLRPKFEAVEETLSREIGGLGFASWSKPRGGYFISLDVLPGTAERTIALAAEAGVIMTPAGSTWPYHKDPEDKNIRIAPTYPSTEEIRLAAELLCVCTKLAAIEKLSTK